MPLYGVRVRNTPEQPTPTWASYVKAVREAAGLTGPSLAKRLGVNAATVWRWETGKQKPESTAVPQALAELFGLDLDEVLAAAGLKPDVAPKAEPTMEVDEEIHLVRTDPNLTEAMKERIIALIQERRERDRAAALEETRRLIDLFRRS